MKGQVTPPSTLYDLLPPWEPQTPSNAIEVQSQSTYIKERLVRHQNSPPTLLLTSVNQFGKGAMRIIHQITLLQEENLALRKANNELSRHRRTKKCQLQDRGSLTVGEEQALQAQCDVNLQLQADSSNGSGRTNPNPPQSRRCGACGETGHNVRTCQNGREMSSNSDSDFN